jgi:hypothetical protein
VRHMEARFKELQRQEDGEAKARESGCPTPLHEQAIGCEGHLIAQNVVAGARQLMGERFYGEQRIALPAFAFVKRCAAGR